MVNLKSSFVWGNFLRRLFLQRKVPQFWSASPLLSSINFSADRTMSSVIPDNSAIKTVDDLLANAYQNRASDVHICPGESAVTVRLRIDGHLRVFDSFPQSIHEAVINRLKVLAGLRTDDQNSVQDGRFHISISSEVGIDVRVSIVPTYFGQNAVLRLLVSQAGTIDLTGLGFSASMVDVIVDTIQRPHGMILVTGPTGSGKTTTLYALVNKVNRPEISIVTIEDPVEYSMPGVSQIQVSQALGLSFVNGLRSLVRQDPDVLMVGEVRDAETARMAVNAALTGHLVFSSFHTNDAATAIPRLLHMGVEPYMVASALEAIIGQRLVRRICPACKQARSLSNHEATELRKIKPLEELQNSRVFFGLGCDSCGQSGYAGRIAIGEVLTITDDIRCAILSRAPAATIRSLALTGGMVPLVEDAWQKVQAGLTTIDELLYACR